MFASKILKFWFPVILYSGIIFGMSSIPFQDKKPPFFHFDKVIHFFEYAPYGFLVARARGGAKSGLAGGGVFVFVVLFSLLYACSDEFHQSFVGGRDSSVWDAAADTLGAAMGALIYLKVRNRNQNAMAGKD